MIAREIYERSLTLLGEDKDSEGLQYDTGLFEKSAPGLINILSSMLYELDCHIKNKRLTSESYFPAQISSLEDDVHLHPAICLSVMPIGLAYLLILEENADRAAFFYKLYSREKENLRKRYETYTRHKIKEMY